MSKRFKIAFWNKIYRFREEQLANDYGFNMILKG